MEYKGAWWEISSTDNGIRIQREQTWSARPSDGDELAAIKDCRIDGAFYDERENAMIFLLVNKAERRGKLLKVSQEPKDSERAGQIRYHSMDIDEEDYIQIKTSFYAGVPRAAGSVVPLGYE